VEKQGGEKPLCMPHLDEQIRIHRMYSVLAPENTKEKSLILPFILMRVSFTLEEERNGTIRFQAQSDSPPPLLCPGEATSRGLWPFLCSPVQERHGSSAGSPVEGCRDA